MTTDTTPTITPAIIVHATINNAHHHVAIKVRPGETLGETTDRGVSILLDEEHATNATNVWTEPVPMHVLMDDSFLGEYASFDYTDERGEVLHEA